MKSVVVFVLLLFGVVVCIAGAGLMTQTVEYKPDGVKDGERAKYDTILASLREKEKIRYEATQSNAPVARFESTAYDFGLVDPHSTLSKDFIVRNNGGSPLTLEVEQTTCKCTVGNLADSVLLPGQSTNVTMTWNTGFQAEKYEQKAFVRTNDPLNPTIELAVSGEVKAVLIAPESVGLASTNPKEDSTGRIVLYSQRLDSFSIAGATSDLPGFEWEVAPLSTDAAEVFEERPLSAMVLNIVARPTKRGKFTGEVRITVIPGDGSEEIERVVQVTGKVRAPIVFISNDIHQSQGLDLETRDSSREHQFQLLVRSPGAAAEERRLEVLEVEPKELQATLVPLSRPGNYRLTLTIPKGSPSVMFNRDGKHGYVKVGDPNDEDFSNWFPVLGAIVSVE
ncbi:Ig-like domain-containing protein [Neorhodopirellula pilleata]|uniref:DUF1573 domain-containing protein n=1 Tax=Neorhodopirellula pilleata TaxID=2714738 RepID=A0A5C5ZG95_9BACT|nr:DUF1573 domain-containing protein [Neorhodopirellula pilleata]TWT86077.1 hypothetical protein Pla100_62270 [Neorhodopirellula pilleata]